MFYIGVYVDDIILAGRSDDRIQEVKRALSQKFDLRKLHYFLGMSVVHYTQHGSVNQPTLRNS